ncbi:MAG: pirin family protein [Gammaproteobacteria bacterium]|nr:pirin family protein [Gammaproteobacteria bacterium]
MLQIRRSAERGHANHGWLDSHHTFSFADYQDPAYMGFGALRVINEDRVAPGGGFAPHSHRDMEIISYVLDGALEHKDSLGNGSVICRGDVQRMSAGTGVRHSEYNSSTNEPVHFLQIWIIPAQTGLAPSYEQQHVDPSELQNRLRLIASPDGRAGSVVVHQDAQLYAATLSTGQEVRHPLARGRKAYLQVANGIVRIDDQTLAAGDGAAITAVDEIRLAAQEPAEVLLFDLA